MSPDIIFNEGSAIKDYLFKQPISRGPYSTIFKGINKLTSQNVILKVVPFDKIKAIVKFNEFFNYEKEILLRCKNQNLVRLLQIFSYESGEILVLEYCNGPTLEDVIQEKQKLPESYASYILKQILNAFMALKNINAMHRDFKTQHIYFHNDIVKIGGFSFSKVLKSYSSTTDTSLGTAFTMAPQVLRGEDYGANADIWSIGAVFYKMIFGKYPFRGEDDQEILKSIQTEKIQFEGMIISPNCKDFIDQCLKINSKKRLNWDTIQNHPFIKSLNQCDFKEFKIQKAFELYQNLRKIVQTQRPQTRKKMYDFEQRIKQLTQELVKQRYEVKTLRIFKQENQKLVKSLRKQIQNKNADIDRYQKLLSEKKNQEQQMVKLNEKLSQRIQILNQKIRRFNDKILESFSNETPIKLVNSKSQSLRTNQQMNLKTNNLYVIDEQNFNKLMQMNKRYKLNLNKSNITNTNSTEVSEFSDNHEEYSYDQSQINKNKQTEKRQKYKFHQFYKPAFMQKQKQKFMKSQIFEVPSNIRPSFQRKQPQNKIMPQQRIAMKEDELYFENDILKNDIPALVKIIQTIEGQSLQRIQSSILVYKKTLRTKDLVLRIKEIFSGHNKKRGFLALFQTQSKNKFCIFCYKNGEEFKTVLVNIDRSEVFKSKKQNKISGYIYRPSSQKIYLGAGQIMIKNHPPQLQIDLNIIGDKYFNIEKIEELTGSNENQVNLKQIQIYDIKFKK